MKKSFAILSLLLLPAMAFAQTEEALLSCAEITNDSVRLYCYDVLAGRESIESEGQDSGAINKPVLNTPNTPKNWVLFTERSRIDDSERVFLSTQQLNPTEAQIEANTAILLVIACRENRTNFWFQYGGEHKFGKKNRTITYRIDSRRAQTKQLGESNNGEAIGLWGGNSAIPFVKSLFRANQLYVRVSPIGSSYVETEFDISGLESEVEPLRRSCHW